MGSEFTLVFAVEKHERIHLYLAQHEPGAAIVAGLKAAFREWVKMPLGRATYVSQGGGWEASVQIPEELLEKHGVWYYQSLIRQRSEKQWWLCSGAIYEHTLLVNFDEPLIDAKEAECGDEKAIGEILVKQLSDWQ